MKPTDLIFQAVSNMLGGIAIDVTTVILGVTMLTFMVVGLGMLQRTLMSSRTSKLDNYIKEHGLEGRYQQYKDSQIIRARFKQEFKDFDDL